MGGTTDTWMQAYLALDARVREHPQFRALVRTGLAPGRSRRARALANRICESLGLDPATWRGNVYGAVLDRRAF